MKICIGIISYFPDTDESRKIRSARLNKLIGRCNDLFNLPILIVAQNWKSIVCKDDNIKVYYYENKLGITGARKELRKKFIESEYDYMIMLDDDIQLAGTKPSADEYIKQIQSNPNGFCTFKALTLQLFAISKELFSKIEFPDGEIANGDYFEDMWLIMALKKLYPEKHHVFKRGDLNPIGDAVRDKDSTWFHGQFNKHEIGDRTRAMIKRL